ncbi:hypothetical protein R84B8_02190 [Treponema sp. R8-4-B8]
MYRGKEPSELKAGEVPIQKQWPGIKTSYELSSEEKQEMQELAKWCFEVDSKE